MKKRTIRVLSMILTLVMFLSVSTPAFAVGGGEIGEGWDRDIGEDEIRQPDFDPDLEFEEDYDYFQALDEETMAEVTVEAPMGSLPTLAEVRLEPIPAEDLREAVDEIVEGSPAILVAMDISFWLGEDEIEPEEPVRVKISSPELQGKSNLQVIHFPDDAEEPETVQLIPEDDLTFTLGTNEVAFEADSFSVYAVIGEPEEYSTTLTVNFYKFKSDENPIATVYVKEADELAPESGEKDPQKSYIDDIVYDPGMDGLQDDQLFKGWCRLDGENDVIDENTVAMDIVAVRKQLDAIDIDSITDESQLTVNYYAVIYRFFDVSYFDGDICYGSETLTMPLSTEQVEYPVSMAYVAGGEQNFEGWLVEDGLSHIVHAVLSDENHTVLDTEDDDTENDPTADTVFPNDSVITITGNVKFNVKAPKGHWLVFHENPLTTDNADGSLYKGATYIAPEFLLPSEETSDPNEGEGGIPMKLAGFSFDGWYTGTEDANGIVTLGSKFVFGYTIAETTHLYAKWIPNETAYYTLIVWLQNATLDGYDFQSTEKVWGAPGDDISYDGASHSYTGFEYDHNDISAANKNTKIAASNSTVVNVYYNRKEYTLTFKDLDKNTISFRYNYSNRTATIGDALTDEDIINGMTTRTRGSYTVGAYTVGNWLNQTTYYFIKVDEQWYFLEGNYAATLYNNSVTNIDGPSLQTIKTITAKFGEDISDEFPITTNSSDYTGYVWNPLNSEVFTSGQVPTLQIMPSENTVFTALRYGNTRNAHFMYYLEVTPDDQHTGTGYVQRGGTWYKLYQDVALRIDQSVYSTKTEDFYDLNGFTQLASDPAYDDNDRITLDDSNNYTVRFYYSRDKYQIIYQEGSFFGGKAGTEPMNVPSSAEYEPSGMIYYDADISSYGKDENGNKGEDYFTPEAPDGYVFGGWCVDKSCTAEYDFERMPQGNLTVYAKWVQIRYRVFLHPEAGTKEETPSLTWGSADQAMSFGVAYGDKISAPFGIRDGYEFIGWFTGTKDENGVVTYGKVFNSEFIALTDETVPADPVYDKTVDMTDTIDKWGTVSNPKSNSDAGRYWVTRKLDLYGKWRKGIPGSDGINVIYDLNGGSGEVTDDYKYLDNVEATAQNGPTAAPSEDLHFLYWVVQKWDEDFENEDGTKGAYVDAKDENGKTITAFPGDGFTIHVDDAKVVVTEWKNKQAKDENGDLVYERDPETGDLIKDENGNPIPVYEQEKDEDGNPVFNEDGTPKYVQEIAKATYTIQLRAEYGPVNTPTPSHITWYSNVYDNTGVEIPSEAIEQMECKNPNEEEYSEGDFIYGRGNSFDRQDVQINKGVAIPPADTYTLPGYVFLGWGRVNSTNKLSRDYYLCGTINGEDHANGADWQNLGDYKIAKETGLLSVTFTSNTQIGVKTPDGDQFVWYWVPDSNYGYEADSVQFYPGDDCHKTFNPPLNVKLSLRLEEIPGDDGSVQGVKLYYSIASDTTASASTSGGTAVLRAESDITDPKDLKEELFLKWDSEKAVYQAQNDAGDWVDVTDVACDEKQPYNDLYAVWAPTFYVYHSGVAGGMIETVPLTRALSTDGYDLTQHLGGVKDTRDGETAPVLLYGGYYLEGGFTPEAYTEKTVGEGEEQKTVYIPTASCKAYDGDNWTWTKAETDSGLAIQPKAGVTYYVKEVPAATYLQPYLHYSYKIVNEGDNLISSIWLVSDVDDTRYKEIGFVINGELFPAEVLTAAGIQDYAWIGRGCRSLKITVKDVDNGEAERILKPDELFGAQKNGDYLTFRKVKESLSDNECNLEGKPVYQYWVTPDGVLVTGTVGRTYSDVDSVKISCALVTPTPPATTCNVMVDYSDGNSLHKLS